MRVTYRNRQSLLWKMEQTKGKGSRNVVERNGESVSWSWRSQLIVLLIVAVHYDHDLTHHAQWEKHCLWLSQLGYRLDNSTRLIFKHYYGSRWDESKIVDACFFYNYCSRWDELKGSIDFQNSQFTFVPRFNPFDDQLLSFFPSGHCSCQNLWTNNINHYI